MSGDIVGKGDALLWVGITSSWLYSGSVTVKSHQSLNAKEICLDNDNNSFTSWFYSVFIFFPPQNMWEKLPLGLHNETKGPLVIGVFESEVISIIPIPYSHSPFYMAC